MQLPSGGLVTLAGASAGPPMLFLHGVGGGAWSWRPQVAEFAGDFACFVWEARGHGAARRVADAGLADYYADAREALAAVRDGTSGGITVVGHSMGGLLAIALGAQSPHRINGIVLVDPVYPQNDGLSAHDLGPLTPLMLLLMKPLVASFLRDGAVARAISRWMFTHSFTDPVRMEEAWRDQRRQVPIEYPKMFYRGLRPARGFPGAAVRASHRHAGTGFQPALARARRHPDAAAGPAFFLCAARGRPLSAAGPPGGGQ